MSVATICEGRLLEVNDAFCEVSGYTRSELIGRSATELGIVTSEEREAIVGATPDHGTVRDFEIVFRRRDGSLRRGLISASPIEFAGMPCLLNATIDMTDRWAAEHALRESEERFRTVFESAGDGIVIVDEAGRYLDANRAALERLGYTREEFLALSSDAVAPRGAALNRDRLAIVLEGGFLRFDDEIVARDGTGIPIEITATPMELGGTRVVLVIARDLTEFKRAEAEREAVERESARISRLAAAVSALDATIGASSDEDSLFHGTTSLLVSAGGLAIAGLALVEPAGRLRIYAIDGDENHTTAGIRASEGSLRLASKAEERALQTGQVVIGPENDSEAAGGPATEAVVPIGGGGFAVGVITLQADDPGFFGGAEVQLIEQVASLVASRLGEIQRNDREHALTVALEAERRDAERFAAMTATIDRSLDRVSRPGDLYREACRLPVDMGVCVLARFGLAEADPKGMRLRFVVSVARDGPLELEADARLGRSMPFSPSGDAATSETGTIVANDVLVDPRFRRRHRALREAGLRAVVEVPVFRGRRAAGSMCFYAQNVGAFGVNEVALLDRLAVDVGHRLTAIESERRRRTDKKEIARLLDLDPANAVQELGRTD